MASDHICIIGSFDSTYDGHLATRDAVVHAAAAERVVVNTRWITPDELSDPAAALAGARGAIVACRNPKHPRRLMPDVLGALTWLRRAGRPTFGIECGFQHMVIEIARDVLGHADANSVGYDEETTAPVLHRLDPDAPREAGRAPRPREFSVRAGSRLAAAYAGAPEIREPFRSEFTVNGDYVAELEAAGASFSADGRLGERRFAAAMEWGSLPYYLGVAFLPQFRSTRDEPHPLFRAFLRAAMAR
ncbi:MAG: hypothetical protein R3F20_15830 [Planctomycetota bacterium]